jgi:hypothetical protein
VLLIGGEPLGEKIVMWWNFVGRSHEEIVAYRAQWQAEIGAAEDSAEESADGAADGAGPASWAAATAAAGGGADLRFGPFPAGEPAALPAPALPNARLRPRG